MLAFVVVLLGATIHLPPNVSQANWKAIGKTSVGNPVYVDPKSVKKAPDGIVTATLRAVFVKPIATPKGPITASRGEVPEQFDAVALDKFLGRGGVALACNLALADCVELIKSKDGVSDAEARKQAIAYMVPGVILQPSGVFSVIRAQEVGASYIRAS